MKPGDDYFIAPWRLTNKSEDKPHQSPPVDKQFELCICFKYKEQANHSNTP